MKIGIRVPTILYLYIMDISHVLWFLIGVCIGIAVMLALINKP